MTLRPGRWLDLLRRVPELGALTLGLALLVGLLWLVRTHAPDTRASAASRGRSASGAASLAQADATSKRSRPQEQPTLIVARVAIEHLRAARERESGIRTTTAAEERALVEQAIDEEVLYREALALNADRGPEHQDPVIVQRAKALAREIDLGRTGEGNELTEAARDLGLERSDLVIRRYLVESMRLALARGPGARLPSEDELREYYDRNAASFALPARVRLTQVYFADDRRGGRERAVAAATSLRDRLRETATGPDGAVLSGDPFPRGADLQGSPDELDRVFGAGFARALGDAGSQQWAGPIESAYGAHLVWVRERIGARTPRFEEVRARLLNAWLEEAGERRLRAQLDRLRARYRIEIAPAETTGS